MLEKQAKSAWQQALVNGVTNVKDLLTFLELPLDLLPSGNMAANTFPLRVTHSYMQRMQKGNIHDPLLKQILPLGLELAVVPGYEQDPLQENKSNPIPGLLHKYKNRVLVTLTSACAVNCRYCFRRHFPYMDNNPGKKGWEKMMSYIAQDPTIEEVILSGGDPLTMNDQGLFQFCDSLSEIEHIKRLRIHSRLPIVLPQRITADFLAFMQQLPLQKIMVVHANHPQEINQEVIKSLLDLHSVGFNLLNQSVLLKGINNDVPTLVNLSKTLFEAHVLPYYLHVLDKVAGAAHFDISLVEAKKIYKELKQHLPGYLVPRLAREQPGFPSKTFL